MSDRRKRQPKQVECQCGCGQFDWHNKMVVVEAEEAVDHDIRKTGTVRKFWVLSQCREDFEHELALTIMLQKLIRVWYDKPFWKRIFVAHNVLKMQHKIWERTRGFEYARTHATNSAILFAAPRFIQGFLARRFGKRLARAEEKRKSDQEAESKIVSMASP